ncbi:(2Fe-2S)-binding protein [Halobacillus halophilus]|uniref:FAD-dependent oxidoreductase / Rieske-type iron-sulfur protein n=1 Tax=Halobacillus halophilus (strain ATCC 35676 / DSM 2266 / JCM 20832 / KCTC 3685 / LMG 17431 / NBRC 102448 / NCIMB 2269) TaxID=866895 RepID=I0JSK4_HALH3|nr:FAD-dependent oxidoreductase [Halobacillus halophilus]ASF41060.1 (2Fe-2S)-binding protein [Halobacillus halophilus]CCG47126.1 FAD-dependent oxidoreductase / Rieske-type iron-sulfur protein [Halobacillus halophilus DSM 2266]
MDKQQWTKPQPMWLEDTSLPSFNELKEDTSADVAVIGGGITGITTAYLLAKQGKQVILLDSDHLLNGTTGHTTAKVTAQHGLIYYELMKHFGTEDASLYYQAQMSAFSLIEELIQKYDISCDWKKEDALLYATTNKGALKLDQEYEAYRKIGIEGSLNESLPFDVEAKKALVMHNQARFHPLKYLSALIEEFTKLGGEIYENTKAIDLKEGAKLEIHTGSGATVTCDKAVSCSHFPFYDGKGFYFSRMYAERSYLMAIEPEREIPDGMYLSVDEPKRTIRTAEYNGKPILLVGGESHKTGMGVNTSFHYNAIEEFAAQTFGIKKKLFQWSAQDLTTLDKVPYIGPITRRNDRVFIATGFRKWGMTNGTLAAQLISQSVAGEDSLFHSLFKPSRFKTDPSMKQFLSQNFDVAVHLVEGKLELVADRPQNLKKGEGLVVQWKGERAGAFKDEEDQIHLLDTTCTHMGCEVEWNDAERTWDCPCHGSRFSFDGTVVEGPADQPLMKIAFPYPEQQQITSDEINAEEEQPDQI